jgi:hypothetical protein
MTLRIFQVSTDGVAQAVPLGAERHEPSAPTPLPPAPPKGPERWTGSSEWDSLRARLKEQEPKIEPPARRRR